MLLFSGVLLATSSSWADDTNCLECHFKGGSNPLNHTPAADNMCDVCHEKNDKHYSVNYSSDVCANCHDVQLDVAVKHKPLTEGKQCVNCHNPHGSENKFFLRQAVPDLCTKCHTGMKNQTMKSTHDVAYSADDGACVSCHQPHGGANEKLLRKPKVELCVSCHNKEQPYVGDYPTNNHTLRDMQKVVETSTYTHPPAKAKQCTTCHTPHQSGKWWLLNNNAPTDNATVKSKNWKLVDDKFKVCFTCHNIKMLNEKIDGSETNFRRDTKIKPWYLFGKTQIVRENLHLKHNSWCTMCHDVHGSQRQHLIRLQWKAMPKGGTCGGGCHGDLDRYETGVVYQRLE